MSTSSGNNAEKIPRSILDEQVPEINISILGPTRYVAPKTAAPASVSNKMGEWYDWLVHHVPKTIKDRKDHSSV